MHECSGTPARGYRDKGGGVVQMTDSLQFSAGFVHLALAVVVFIVYGDSFGVQAGRGIFHCMVPVSYYINE